MKLDRRQIKRATELLVDDLGGCEKAGAIVGKGKTTIARWYDHRNPDNEDYSAPVADLRELEANASQPFVTLALCRLNGGVFVPLPDCAADPDTMAGMVMQLAARLGALSQEMAAALADSVVSGAEAGRLLARMHEHDAVAAALRLALERIEGNGDARAAAPG